MCDVYVLKEKNNSNNNNRKRHEACPGPPLGTWKIQSENHRNIKDKARGTLLQRSKQEVFAWGARRCGIFLLRQKTTQKQQEAVLERLSASSRVKRKIRHERDPTG